MLGLKNTQSSFEDILTAKNKQLAANQNKEKQMEVSSTPYMPSLVVTAAVAAHMHCVLILPLCMQIEAAYDVLFMQSMKKRITGDLEVPTSVRYADVPTRKRSGSVSLQYSNGFMQAVGAKVSTHKKIGPCA